MASISHDGNGLRRILFVAGDGTRKAVRLGHCSAKVAEKIKGRVQDLIAAQHGPLDEDTAKWVAAIDDKLHTRLAAVGLVKPREHSACTLGVFMSKYFAALAVKTGTATAYSHSKRCLIAFFGETKALRDIGSSGADEYRTWLIDHERLSGATVSRRIGVARMMFKRALRWKLISENPFAETKMGSQANKERAFFVTREMADKVLAACPDNEWRLLFALSRYGGLRCPSEHLALKWGDIDWERNRIRVPSPKTAHHAGGDCRSIPLFPELLPYLREAFEVAEPGEEFVVRWCRDSSINLRTQLTRIIKRAGLKPWQRLFQNLRATRETELAERYPIHVVCSWIGNSRAVAQSHYLQITDEHFEQAATSKNAPNEPAQKAAQNPAQRTTEIDGKESQGMKKPSICEGLREDATPNKDLVGAVGFEPT